MKLSDAMCALLLRLLFLLVPMGLVLAPAGTGSSAMAWAAPAAAAMDHDMDGSGHPCDENQAPAGQKAPDDCCAASGSFLAAAQDPAGAQRTGPREIRPFASARAPTGLEPEADPPPPRSS